MRTRLSELGQWFLKRPRNIKRLISIQLDVVGIIAALWAAFSLRLGVFYLPPAEQLWIFFLAPLIAVPIFVRFGLYRAIVRYIGMDAIWTIFRAVVLFMLLFSVTVLISGDLAGNVPRTVYGIHAVLVMLFVGGSRMMARWLFHKSIQRTWQKKHSVRHSPPVLIYGAGNAGIQLAAMLKVSHQLQPVGFIDDNVALQKQQIDGLSVYAFEQLPKLIQTQHIRDVLLAMPAASRHQRNVILQKLEPYPVHVRTLPDLMDIAEGRIEVSDIQEVNIDDVLGREPVIPNQQLLSRNISQKVVMVTGAGGSIGSELCRQVMLQQPQQLILYEQSEFSLYQIEKELQQLHPTIPIIAVLGNILNQSRLEVLCRQFGVQTIYHAAAYKHVPIVERNPNEGVRNNVFGTLSCAKAAIAAGVDTFVLISTDKAVRPTNTMGASKRMAELVLQALASNQSLCKQTRFTMVRFGNVLGSSGSVVPLFRDQIANGGPVTVTHPEIIRYFMTIPEAAELVIQAGAMGQGGDVFVLDMGEPVKIVELARRMIHLSGFTVRDEAQPNGDIEIRYTGLRPGEKLYEELLIGENVTKTSHEKIMRAQELVILWPVLQQVLNELELASENDQSDKVRQILLSTVEGFTPQCENSDWLSNSISLH